MTTIKHHGNILSQPSRSVSFALKKLDVKHDFVHWDIPEDTRSDKFKTEVSSRGAVPVLQIGDDKLTESGTIIRYLFDTYDKEEALLPRTDRMARARVEEIIDISGTSVRPPFIKASVELSFKPLLYGMPKPSEEETKNILDDVHKVLKSLETLLEGKKYFTGEDLTIGDVQVYNEVLNVSTF